MKISIYPSYKRDTSKGNPFINNLYDSFPTEANIQYVYGRNQEGFFKNLFKSDVYILNWPENVIFDRLGCLQIFVFVAFLHVLLIRKAKLVWIFHNIEPHEGHNFYSRYIYRFMMKHSSVIIALSRKGTTYLRDKTNATIKYHPHPFKALMRVPIETHKIWDLYIWGGINKYKGIVEFLDYLKQNGLLNKYRILITGKCNDIDYDSHIRSYINDNISYENGFITNNDLITNIDKCHYVLFPYLENSVSSSGALMDSLEYGAQVIGPNVGAFKDAMEHECCLTFESYEDIIDIIENRKYIQSEKVRTYVQNNQWDVFGMAVYKDIINNV